MNTNKIKGFLKNKNTVTALASILIVLILVVGYNVRVTQATTPVQVPISNVTIEPRTEIEPGFIDYISVPSSAIKGTIFRNSGDIIGLYTKENVIVPEGSFFYVESLTTNEGNIEKELYDKVAEGETLNYITVDMLSTYSNSIVPGNYIDIYAYVQDDGHNKVAKLLENIKVIAVRTGNGLNVFESTAENRVPFVIYFGLPYEEDMLLKKIHAINSWGAGSSSSMSDLALEDPTINTNIAMSTITLFPIPTTVGFDSKTKEKIKISISSEEMAKIIDDRADDITTPDSEVANNANVKLDDLVDNTSDNTKEDKKDNTTTSSSNNKKEDTGNTTNSVVDDFFSNDDEE